MTTTLEKEFMEEEAKQECTIFETELFKEVMEAIWWKNESKECLDFIQSGVIKYLTEKCPETIVGVDEKLLMTAYMMGASLILGGDKVRELRAEQLANNAFKRVIRKENMIGFEAEFEDGTKGGVLMPKEQYEALVEKGIDAQEIINRNAGDRKVKSWSLMDADTLNDILEKSADQILKGEFND